MDLTLIIQRIAAYALPLLFALTIREMVRGHVADRLGDLTARQQGRLSLNPLSYVDPVGTVALPLVLMVLSAGAGIGIMIGWPRQVPINAGRLRHPRRDIALIALGSLGANLVMAIVWAILLRVALGYDTGEGVWAGIKAMTVAGVSINASLLVLNLLPLLPFDMGQLLVARLPPRRSEVLFKLQPYAFIIVLILAITKVLVLPLILVIYLVLMLAGLPLAVMLQ